MPGWSDLQDELKGLEPGQRGDFITKKTLSFTGRIARHHDCNVLYYASSFLQKPHLPSSFTALSMEDIHGFMAGLRGQDFTKDLLLILHTPGGMAEAAQTIVDYLRSKFKTIDVVVPTYAMSAGTMIALGCDRIIMGGQSQLGPTDPQLIVGDRAFSAHSIVEQFEEAKTDIIADPALAHAWAPVLRAFGPALLQEARNSISYGESLVKDWLQEYMFRKRRNRASLASKVAKYFGSHKHGSHGRRINRHDAKNQQLAVVKLEDDPKLQDDVLTLYHLSTIAFENTPTVKSVASSNRRLWVKNMAVPAQ